MAANPLKAIIDEIKIDLKQFVDDNRFDKLDDFLADKIHTTRSTLIREEFNQKGSISEQYYQVDSDISVSCEQTSVTIGDFIIQSNKKIFTAVLPSLIENVGWFDISYLGLDAFTGRIDRVKLGTFISSDYGRYAKNKAMYMMYGAKVFFKNLPLNTQKLTGAMLYKNPLDHTLFTEDSEYYSPSRKRIVLLVKKDILATWNIPFDEINDARETVLVPSGAVKKEAS